MNIRFSILPLLSGTQIASSLRRIILSSVAFLALPYFFFTFSHRPDNFRKNVLKINMFWFYLQICPKDFSI